MSSVPEVWAEITRQCNILLADQNSWWSRIVGDPDLVIRLDPSGLVVRLCGHNFLKIVLMGQELALKIAHEYLVPAPPGSRAMLTAHGASPKCARIDSLAALGARYPLIRQRVCSQPLRRAALLDRLYLRHHCFLAVDASLPWGQADLVALAPDGTCVCLLLRSYTDQDLRLRGQHGIGACLRKIEARLGACASPQAAITAMITRSRSLEGPWTSRFARLPEVKRVYPRARLLVVDFDLAQRHGGLNSLRHDLEQDLGPGYARADVLTIGDPGNIRPRDIFADIDPDQLV